MILLTRPELPVNDQKTRINQVMAQETTDRPLLRATAFAVACSVAFAAGLAFDTYLWGEERRVTAAVLRANDLQRLIDTLGFAISQTKLYEALGIAKSPEALGALRASYRESALRNLEQYERQLNELPDDRRRALLTLHSELSADLKRRLSAQP